jgi:hypothetical protein
LSQQDSKHAVDLSAIIVDNVQFACMMAFACLMASEVSAGALASDCEYTNV